MLEKLRYYVAREMLITSSMTTQAESELSEESQAPFITIDQGVSANAPFQAEKPTQFYRVIIEHPPHGLEIDYLIDHGDEGQVRVNYATSTREWIITLEQEAAYLNKFAQVASLRYDNQGRLLEAAISLDGFSTNSGDFLSKKSREEYLQPTNPYNAVLQLHLKYHKRPQVSAYFSESHSSSPELLTPTGTEVIKYYEKADALFRASWYQEGQVLLEGSQGYTGLSKKCAFPLILPIKNQTLLHKHLDQAWFPLENIYWSTQF